MQGIRPVKLRGQPQVRGKTRQGAWKQVRVESQWKVHVEAEDRSTHQALVKYFKQAVERKIRRDNQSRDLSNSALGGDCTESVTNGNFASSPAIYRFWYPILGIRDYGYAVAV